MTSLRRPAPALAVLALALLSPLTGCGNDTKTPEVTKSQCTYREDPAGAAKKVDPPPGDPPKDLPDQMTISTNRGDIRVSLDKDVAPCTVNAFVSLAKQGFFDDTHCHRLTTADTGLFVLQCGDPRATGKPDSMVDGSGGPGFYVADELEDDDPRLQPCYDQVDKRSGRPLCTYTTGTVAMANAGADTGGSQFFLVYRDSPLPAAYTVFGKMSAAGVKVVQDIAAAGAYPPNANGNTAPRLETVITSVK